MPKRSRKRTPATVTLRRRLNDLEARVASLITTVNVGNPEQFAEVEAQHARTAGQVEAFGRRLLEFIHRLDAIEAKPPKGSHFATMRRVDQAEANVARLNDRLEWMDKRIDGNVDMAQHETDLAALNGRVRELEQRVRAMDTAVRVVVDTSPPSIATPFATE